MLQFSCHNLRLLRPWYVAVSLIIQTPPKALDMVSFRFRTRSLTMRRCDLERDHINLYHQPCRHMCVTQLILLVYISQFHPSTRSMRQTINDNIWRIKNVYRITEYINQTIFSGDPSLHANEQIDFGDFRTSSANKQSDSKSWETEIILSVISHLTRTYLSSFSTKTLPIKPVPPLMKIERFAYMLRMRSSSNNTLLLRADSSIICCSSGVS